MAADRPLSRRAVLRAGAAAAAAAATPFVAPLRRAGAAVPPARSHPSTTRRDDLLPSPDLGDARILRFVAGLRPYRRGGVRLEVETIAGKPVVHHYGHGGAGVTLSWGGAELAADLVAGVTGQGADVAVIGAGAVGLATARVLLERGFAVHVLAADFSPGTTSDVAGAEWLPFGVERGESAADRARFDAMTSRAWRRFEALANNDFGVERRVHFDTGPIEAELRSLPAGTIEPAKRLDRLPFAGVERGGISYETFFIEPARYLPALLRDVLLAGAVVRQRRFTSRDEIAALPEACVVDCTGLGAAQLFGDATLVPVRGQLVHLFPQPLPWLLSHEGGYCFPRRDALVLGGTFERGITAAAADPAACRAILDRHRRFFAGEPAPR